VEHPLDVPRHRAAEEWVAVAARHPPDVLRGRVTPDVSRGTPSTSSRPSRPTGHLDHALAFHASNRCCVRP
jgi:hypothetical protein